MPKQVLPSPDEFEAWIEDLHQEDFRSPNPKEVAWLMGSLEKDDQPLKKRHKGGLEFSLIYERMPCPVIVCVWTTYIRKTRTVRKSDAGWVILLDKRFPGKPIFFSFPIMRTKNFLRTLKQWTMALKHRVDTWPHPCKECGQPLTLRLVKGNKMHETAFACPRHGYKFGGETWLYQGMDENHKKFLERMFQRYDRYREKLMEEGKVVVPRRVLRVSVARSPEHLTQAEGSQLNPLVEANPFNDMQYAGWP